MATKKINGVYHVSNTQTGGSGDDPNAVKYVEQTLTDAQKAQARTNINAPSVADLNAIGNGSYVEAWDGASTPVVADIPAGVVVTYNTTDYTGTLAASASTVGKIYLVSTGTSGNYDRYITETDGTNYSWHQIGTTAIDLSDYATKEEVSQLSQEVDGIPEVVKSGTIPVVAGQYNTKAGGAVCNIAIPAGEYTLVIDSSFFDDGGSNVAIYATINGAGVQIGTTVKQVNGQKVTLSGDATDVYIWTNASGAIKTGDCAFSFKQEKKIGLLEEVSLIRKDTLDFQFEYQVVAGGNNGRTINISLPAGGAYSILVEDINTGNSGVFGFDPIPSGSIQGTNNECEIGKERGFVATANITGITIRDINPAITASGNMRIVIKNLRSNLSRIDNRDNIEENFSNLFNGTFINGSIVGGALSTYRGQYRACSIELLRYARDLLIKARPGYKFGIHTFNDSGVFIADSGWKTDHTIPANTNFKVIISTTNDNIILSPEVARENVVISTLLDAKTDATNKSISVSGSGSTGVFTTIQFPSRKIKVTIPSLWPISNVGPTGNNVLSIGYVKGGVSYDLQALTKEEMDSHPEKEFLVVFPEFDYDSTYIFIRADSGATAVVEWAEYHDYDLIDSGRNYEGEIIQPKSRFALSQIGQLKNFGTIDETKLNAQGMAVYEDRYILQGSNRIGVGSHLLVVDTKTPSVSMLTIETLAEGQGFHMNNVNLGNKYDATDTLPLVYCSEFYNQHTCKVLRIANDFNSFTEVQTISYSGSAIDTTAYDWVVDAEKNLLYLISFPVSGIKVLCFSLPSTSSANVILTDSDVIKTVNIPNTSGKTLLSQGGSIINGKLWTVFGMDTSSYPGFLAVSDIESGKMVSFVDLSGMGEAEAVSLYKEGVLLCVASGLVSTGASLRNPSYVYMIFNN